MNKLLILSALCTQLIGFTACQSKTGSPLSPATPSSSEPYPVGSSCLTVGYNSSTYTLTNFRIQCQRIEDAYYPFEGIAKDKISNEPLKDVTAVLEKLRDGKYQKISEATSNQSGAFSLTFADSGEYRLTLNKANYKPLERKLNYATKEGAYGSDQPIKPEAVELLLEKN